MLRLIIRLAIAAILLLRLATAASAAEAKTATDANLVTALDMSDSIMRHEEWLQFEGLAVTSATVLDAIAGGRHGRIGFAVITWSSGGRFEVLVPWTLVGSLAEAERVASALRVFGIDRSGWARRGNGSGGTAKTPALRTDISGTIKFAADLALAAPYVSPRPVINVCANGKDNVGTDPRAARDRALAHGIVINALVIGPKKGLAGYFREHVRGGTGSFVTEVTEPAALAGSIIDKLLRNLIAVGHRGAAGPFT